MVSRWSLLLDYWYWWESEMLAGFWVTWQFHVGLKIGTVVACEQCIWKWAVFTQCIWRSALFTQCIFRWALFTQCIWRRALSSVPLEIWEWVWQSDMHNEADNVHMILLRPTYMMNIFPLQLTLSVLPQLWMRSARTASAHCGMAMHGNKFPSGCLIQFWNS